MFGHEKLGAYSRSLEFVELALTIIEKIPKGNAVISEQLRRAAFSIVLNIAEGSGKQSRAEKNHYYQIARGSSMECAAILDILEFMQCVPSGGFSSGKLLLREIVGILTATIAEGIKVKWELAFDWEI